ncbi:hypothetical protein, partial [Staphylococcus aureus]|uniref:hypothetical protein n=1 Tax=Staphylococcus aureus TaxID=1280 RepID=UPI0021B1D23B
MLKQIRLGATKISVVVPVAFLMINYMGMEKGEMVYLVGRSIIGRVALIVICVRVFSIINCGEGKIKVGTTLPIGLIIGIILG